MRSLMQHMYVVTIYSNERANYLLLLSANCRTRLHSVDCKLWTPDSRLQTVDCRLQTDPTQWTLPQVSRKYKSSTEVLEEKQDELKVQKEEIKLLKITVESYDSKVNEQTQLINKLEMELTNVKGKDGS